MLLLLMATACCSSVEVLPDMRQVFARAERIAAATDDRLRRVLAWAAVIRLYPEDEPSTENDDIWRMLALRELARLDATAAAYPPPRPAAPPPPEPAHDPWLERLGATCAPVPSEGRGVLLVPGADGPDLGFDGPTVVRAIGGEEVDGTSAANAAWAADDPAGGTTLVTADGRRMRLAWNERGPARVLDWAAKGAQTPGERQPAFTLPAFDGAWGIRITGPGAVVIDGRRLPQPVPEATGWSTIIDAEIRRRIALVELPGMSPGAWSIQAVALRGRRQWGVMRPDAGWVGWIPVHAGGWFSLRVEAEEELITRIGDAAGHLWEARTIPGTGWSQRIDRHGEAVPLSEHAITTTGRARIAFDAPPGRTIAAAWRVLIPDTGTPGLNGRLADAYP